MTVDIESALKECWAARNHARLTREYHARNPHHPKGSSQREEDIEAALRRLKRAMVPIRSFLGKAQYKTQSHTHLELKARVDEASYELQKERRKLWKMKVKK